MEFFHNHCPHDLCVAVFVYIMTTLELQHLFTSKMTSRCQTVSGTAWAPASNVGFQKTFTEGIRMSLWVVGFVWGFRISVLWADGTKSWHSATHDGAVA